MDKNSYLFDIIEWDIQNWSIALKYWEKNSSQNLANCSALEIGSRHGGLSLWMALQGANVICSDMGGPTETARKKHSAYGVSNLVKYESLDATNLSYTEQFDVVCFKSVLGGIGRYDHKECQVKAICEIYKSLKKGGELFFAENLVASPLHQLLRRKFIRWGDAWRYISGEEMEEFLSPFAEIKYLSVGFLGAFGRTETQRKILGYVDKIMDPVVPSHWKYIIVGIAKK
jgi:SAM-dependent methyltransferase